MMVTTSRRTCTKSRRLCRELLDVIPLSSYVLRGKKGLRELISLSQEKGADRILIVTSRGNEPISLIFYSEWTILGELSVSVTLRREMDIPRINSLREDVPFLLQSSEEKADIIAELFGAAIYHGDDAYTFMTYKEGVIDFYRLDVSEDPVGPRIEVKMVA